MTTVGLRSFSPSSCGELVHTVVGIARQQCRPTNPELAHQQRLSACKLVCCSGVHASSWLTLSKTSQPARPMQCHACPNTLHATSLLGMLTTHAVCNLVVAAVNLPGFSFMVDAMGLPAVAPCPVNTYNQGMRRQRTCWPCPAGYTTNGLTGRTDISACGEHKRGLLCLVCGAQYNLVHAAALIRCIMCGARHDLLRLLFSDTRVPLCARLLTLFLAACSRASWFVHAVPYHRLPVP